MAHNITASTAADVQGVTFVRRIAADFVEARRKRREFQRIVDELSQYSPRELNDIGLSNHDIRGFAHRAVYGDA